MAAADLNSGTQHDEINELAVRKNQGDLKARETMILSQLRLVQTIANQYTGKGVPFEDLYQEGCYGLICAVDQYDPNHPFASLPAFSTHYIKKYINKALIKQNDNSPIVLSEEYYYLLRRYQRAYYELNSALGRPPTTEELAEVLDIAPSYVRKCNCLLFQYISLDDTQSTPDSGGRPIGTMISATPGTDRPTEDAALSLLNSEEDVMNKVLDDIERKTVLRRIGATSSGEPETFGAISEALGISTERARRAYYRGISKLREALGPEYFGQKNN